MHPTLDLSTPALDLDIDEIPGRVEMDMGMAQSGTESALAGIQTPLAAYAGKPAHLLSYGSDAQHKWLFGYGMANIHRPLRYL